jgi:hypothetical protein
MKHGREEQDAPDPVMDWAARSLLFFVASTVVSWMWWLMFKADLQGSMDPGWSWGGLAIMACLASALWGKSSGAVRLPFVWAFVTLALSGVWTLLIAMFGLSHEAVRGLALLFVLFGVALFCFVAWIGGLKDAAEALDGDAIRRLLLS